MSDLPAFDFVCPTRILCGRLALEHLPSELAERGCHRPFFIFSRQTSDRLFPKIIHQTVADSGISMGVVGNVPDRPEREDLSHLRDILNQSICDVVIAVGNGGVADLAKLLCLSSPDENHGSDPGMQAISSVHHAMSFGMIPQADATGLETSGQVKTPWLRKQSIDLMPDFVVLDRRTVSPENVRSALKASVRPLARAAEQAVRPDGNPFAETYAVSAIALMLQGLEPLLLGQQSDDAFLSLASGIAYSGLSVGDATAGEAFRLAETISEVTGIDPGGVITQMFPMALEEIHSYRKTALGRLLYPIAGIERYANMTEMKRPQAAIAYLREILTRIYHAAIDVPGPKLKDADIQKTTLLNRVSAAGVEGVNDTVVRQILDRAWSDEPTELSDQGEDR